MLTFLKFRGLTQKFGPPLQKKDGWFTMDWTKKRPPSNFRFNIETTQRAWHGSKLASIFAISESEFLMEDSDESRGEAHSVKALGAYFHKDAHRCKALIYPDDTPLDQEGGYYYSVMWADRSDKVQYDHKDQWVQPGRSIALRGLWIKARHASE